MFHNILSLLIFFAAFLLYGNNKTKIFWKAKTKTFLHLMLPTIFFDIVILRCFFSRQNDFSNFFACHVSTKIYCLRKAFVFLRLTKKFQCLRRRRKGFIVWVVKTFLSLFLSFFEDRPDRITFGHKFALKRHFFWGNILEVLEDVSYVKKKKRTS